MVLYDAIASTAGATMSIAFKVVLSTILLNLFK